MKAKCGDDMPIGSSRSLKKQSRTSPGARRRGSIGSRTRTPTYGRHSISWRHPAAANQCSGCVARSGASGLSAAASPKVGAGWRPRSRPIHVPRSHEQGRSTARPLRQPRPAIAGRPDDTPNRRSICIRSSTTRGGKRSLSGFSAAFTPASGTSRAPNGSSKLRWTGTAATATTTGCWSRWTTSPGCARNSATFRVLVPLPKKSFVAHERTATCACRRRHSVRWECMR